MLSGTCLSALRRFVVFLVAAICYSASAQSLGLRHEFVLNSGWEFRQIAGAGPLRVPQWHPAFVPGDVHLDLLRDGLIPDPFYRDNVARLQWIEDDDWEYRDSIHVDSAMLRNPHIDLVFEGLDTNAQIYLNGALILNADNMFREWRIDVKSALHLGDNALRVVFPSPTREAARIAALDPWRNASHVPTPVKTYLRKAAYEYGWDWGPRFVTSGIWREARLEMWGEARISDLFIAQQDIHPEVAHLLAEVEITVAAPAEATVNVAYSEGSSQRSASRSVVLHAGVNHVDFPISIDKPNLWYPVGYGNHPLYTFRATVESHGKKQDSVSTSTGLRSIVLRRDSDQWGRSFEFVVNGIPIFAKGASVIPFDSFPGRVTDSQVRDILQSAVDANMNMVRVWGGGYYETHAFYNLCDKLGLMVWQDFMFGNEWQPGTYAFRQNVAAEVIYQIRRLRNHPSIVLWCGNNETEASWEWSRTVAMTLNSPEIARHMWQNYLLLFSGVVAENVEKYDPTVPYWPSSPSADYEDTSGDFLMPNLKTLSSPQTYLSGDMHLYGIQSPDNYEMFLPRFMSEYGSLSFPDMQTLRAYTGPQDLTSISTPVMLAHQDGDAGNAVILGKVRELYGNPKDIPSLVYLSQLLQAEWVKTGAEHLRRSMPRTMGSLFWQLNDCWPVASLSSIDYDRRWKALQFYARRFYSPLLVSPNIENGTLAVYVISDELDTIQAAIRLRIIKSDGTILSEKTERVAIPRLSSSVYLRLPLEDVEKIGEASLASVFADVDVEVGGRIVSRNVRFFVPWRDLQFPKPAVKTEIIHHGRDYTVRVSSNFLARDVYLSFGDAAAVLSDNYFDVLPGESREIDVTSTASLEQLRASLKVVLFEDALANR